MRRLPVLFGIILFSSVQCWAGAIGTIRYLDGDFEVFRDGKALAASRLEEGLTLEDLDTVVTGVGTRLEIALHPSTGIGGVLLLRERTRIFLRISDLRTTQKGAVGLITGSIGLKVDKLLGGARLEVQTERVSLGVRGTEFDVVSNPAGDVLVVTSEGSVECSDGETILRAVAGTSVESLRNEGVFRSIPFSGDASVFRDTWVDRRLKELVSHSTRTMEYYRQQYDRTQVQFTAAFSQLAAVKATVDLWKTQHNGGSQSAPAELNKEKKALVGPLFAVLRSLDSLDWFRSRIADLIVIGKGGFAPEFSSRFLLENQALERQVAEVRYLMKLYAIRNNGEFPAGFLTTELD